MRSAAPHTLLDDTSEKTSNARGRHGDLKDTDKRILWGHAGGRCQRRASTTNCYQARRERLRLLQCCALTFPTHETLARDVLSDSPLYKFSVEHPDPNLIQAHEDVQLFMRQSRELLSHIERSHGHRVHVHVFGTLPVSCSVALGRVRVKGALPITVYNRLNNPGRYVPGVVFCDQ